jgi:hypothetical protein
MTDAASAALPNARSMPSARNAWRAMRPPTVPPRPLPPMPGRDTPETWRASRPSRSMPFPRVPTPKSPQVGMAGAPCKALAATACAERRLRKYVADARVPQRVQRQRAVQTIRPPFKCVDKLSACGRACGGGCVRERAATRSRLGFRARSHPADRRCRRRRSIRSRT